MCSISAVFASNPILQNQSTSAHFSKLAQRGDTLPGDQYETILRGSYGFLWLGTQRGLIRYDSESIRWYRHDPEQEKSLSSNDIQVLFEDSRQRLWVGTSQGLNLLDRLTGSVQRIVGFHPSSKPNFDEAIWTIAETATGLWFGTEFGLFLLEEDGVISPMSGPKRVSSLAVDQKQTLWIGSDGHGLFFKPKNRAIQSLANFSEQQILGLLAHPNGKVWVGTSTGLFSLERGFSDWQITRNLPVPGNAGEPGLWVSELTLDSKNRIWAGTAMGVYQLDESNIRHYLHDPDLPQSLSGNRIGTLYCDTQDILWINTQVRGLDQLNLNEEMMGLLPMKDNEVQSIYLASDDSLWVGTKPQGLAVFKDDILQPTWSLKEETIRQVMQTQQGWLLVGTDTGLFSRNSPNQPFTKLWSKQRVWRILQHPMGQVFLGTDQGLFELIDGRRVVPVLSTGEDPRPILPGGIVTALENDPQSGIWIGTYGGGLHHYLFGKEKVRQFVAGKGPHDLTAADVVDVFLDQSGKVWVATLSGGLNIWDPKTNQMRSLSSKSGFPTDAVVCVLQDRAGTMWANTGVGIISFQPDSSHFRIYTPQEGNHSGAAVPGSGFYDSDQDMLYFGGSKGLVFFQPGSIPDPTKPHIAFTSFSTRAGEQRHLVLPNETLDLAADQAPFTLNYAVLAFLKGPPFQYGYYRSAIDGDWIITPTNTPVSLAGNFTFGSQQEILVQATSENKGSVRSKIFLNIAPPTWYRWLPFLIGAILLIFGSLLFFIISTFERRKRLKLEEQAKLADSRRQLAEDQARLAEERVHMEREKRIRQETHALVLQEHLDQVSTEIANSLHDGPLSQLQGLRFQLRDLATENRTIHDELGSITDGLLPKINRHLRHLCGRMLKPQLTHGLIPELKGIAQSLQSVHLDWQLETELDAQAESLDRAQQIKLIRIFRTLLHNVSKHAEASKVQCTLKIVDAHVHLHMTDNGKGFQVPKDPSRLREKKHYGLYMVDYFTNSMGGRCHIESSPETGTQIDIRFPTSPPKGSGL